MSIGPAIKGSAATERVSAQTGLPSGLSALDVQRIRLDFPILNEKIHGKPLVYLDNGATSQKPRSVIEAVRRFYLADCANVHRAVHLLSERATNSYEGARTKLQRFLGAADIQVQSVVVFRHQVHLRHPEPAAHSNASGQLVSGEHLFWFES